MVCYRAGNEFFKQDKEREKREGGRKKKKEKEKMREKEREKEKRGRKKEKERRRRGEGESPHFSLLPWIGPLLTPPFAMDNNLLCPVLFYSSLWQDVCAPVSPLTKFEQQNNTVK